MRNPQCLSKANLRVVLRPPLNQHPLVGVASFFLAVKSYVTCSTCTAILLHTFLCACIARVLLRSSYLIDASVIKCYKCSCKLRYDKHVNHCFLLSLAGSFKLHSSNDIQYLFLWRLPVFAACSTKALVGYKLDGVVSNGWLYADGTSITCDSTRGYFGDTLTCVNGAFAPSGGKCKQGK